MVAIGKGRYSNWTLLLLVGQNLNNILNRKHVWFLKFPCKVTDAQGRFEVARLYREHINSVGEDRTLEDFAQADWGMWLFWD